MSAFASDNSIPNAARLAAEGLALPMGRSLQPDVLEHVVEAVAAAGREDNAEPRIA